MSTMIIERLDEAMFTHSLMCEVVIEANGSKQPCGNPATFRVKSACPCKPSHSPFFICAECLADLKNGFVDCASCRTRVTTWRTL